MRFLWNQDAGNLKKIKSLSQHLEISSLLARLLINRGLSDPDQAWHFLHPRLQDLHDPFLMKDMDRVVDRIFRALRGKERILIYGDYDVDGITSTAVLKRALEMLGACTGFYLPKRLDEGYGLQKEVLRKAVLDGYHLVISVDTGVRAFEPCQIAREAGLDLIVVDHHLPDKQLPPAYAILNPCRSDCAYPEKSLAAVGVVFKLVQALFRRSGKESVVEHFLKLVAIGTVADVVPVRGENRAIVSFGLKGLAQPSNLGLKTLLKSVGVGREVSLTDIQFRVSPRINAVTRMGGGREVVNLFWTKDSQSAEVMVREMNEKNCRRQQEERKILSEIDERIRKDPSAFKKNFLVVAGQDWHRGVIGIVAARLVERFNRPVLVLSVSDSGAQGSGRSIPGVHLLRALDHFRERFLRFGGHAQAVGCTLDHGSCTPECIQKLSHDLDAYVASTVSPDDLIPSLWIEAILPLEDLSFSLYREINQLAPFGVGNPVPIFVSQKVKVIAGPWVLKKQHLKLQVQRNGSRLDAIWWKNGSRADTITLGSHLDLAYTVTQDAYQGEGKLLLTIRDLR